MGVFRGFEILTEANEMVSIIDPRFGVIVMQKPTLEESRSWIRAYQRGTAWAVVEASNFNRRPISCPNPSQGRAE